MKRRSADRPHSVREKTGKAGKGDLLFLAAVILLAAYGVLCVYSASYYNAEVQYGDGLYFFRKQLVGFLIGLIMMTGAAFLPYEKLKNLNFTLDTLKEALNLCYKYVSHSFLPLRSLSELLKLA